MDITVDGKGASDYEQGEAKENKAGDLMNMEWVAPVVTIEGAMEFHGVNPSEWIVKSYRTSTWTSKPGIQLASIKLVLERRKLTPERDALLGLIAQFKGIAPKRTRKRLKSTAKNPVMVMIGLFDAHFGKQATSGNDDLGEIRELWSFATQDIVQQVSHYDVEKWLLPIGNDMLHVDNKAHTTPRGTPQDMSCRFHEMVQAAYESVLESVEVLADIAPVEIVWVQGNHDPLTSWFLAKMIEAYFHNDKNVVVRIENDTPRHYVRYGLNLIGLTHGNEEKKADLPMLMAHEAKADWAETIFHEWLTGHLHGEESKTIGGVLIRVLKAISGCDVWHKLKGYCMNHRAAEALVYHKENGMINHIHSFMKVK